MAEKLSIGLCQIKAGDGDWDANVERGLAALERAAHLGADIAILPELWTSGYDLANAKKYAEDNRAVIEDVTATCKMHGLYAVAGSFIMEYDDGALRNCLVAYDPDEDKVTTYEKMHLFAGLGEVETFAPGEEPALWSTPFGTFGLALCYDLRFPELFRHYARAGAPMVLMPAQFPHPRIEHWRTLLRARALDNSAFIAGVNTASRPEDKRQFGFSALVNPWGEAVVELAQEEQVVVAEIDLDRAAESRATLGLDDRAHPYFEK